MITTVTTYEELCERGRHAREALGGWRWILGDLALEVDRRWGEDLLGDYAKQVNVEPNALYRYRAVSRFYPSVSRDTVLAATPNLTYTHFRYAMRLGDTDAAYAFLDEAAANGWTCTETYMHLAERLGHAAAPTPALPGSPRDVLTALIAGEVVAIGGRRYKLVEVTA